MIEANLMCQKLQNLPDMSFASSRVNFIKNWLDSSITQVDYSFRNFMLYSFS